MKVTGKTLVLGIIGDPIAHSLSPLMQNEALREAGLDYTYVPFRVAPEELQQAVAGLWSLGVVGFNVTVPHKVAVMPFLARIDEGAARIGAVNAVVREPDGFVGYNTDGIGLLRSLREDFGFTPKGMRIVLFGAGGACRAGAYALAEAGAASIAIVNRTRQKAEELCRRYAEFFPASIFFPASPEDQELERYLQEADVAINTTSAGMSGNPPLAFDLSKLRQGAAVYDMVYAPAVTPLLRDAAAAGRPSANGLGMLAGQGEEAFRIWTGIEPPPGLMKKVLVVRNS